MAKADSQKTNAVVPPSYCDGIVSNACRLESIVSHEEGFPQLVIQEWVGLVVKSGTPDPIIARLNEATNKALAKPSVREALQKIAAEPAGGSPGEFGAHVKSQIAYWGKVVRDSGIKIRE